jgi:hypothetical protein
MLKCWMWKGKTYSEGGYLILSILLQFEGNYNVLIWRLIFFWVRLQEKVQYWFNLTLWLELVGYCCNWRQSYDSSCSWSTKKNKQCKYQKMNVCYFYLNPILRCGFTNKLVICTVLLMLIFPQYFDMIPHFRLTVIPKFQFRVHRRLKYPELPVWE